MCYTVVVMKDMTITMHSEAETRKFGMEIGKAACAGDIIALIGDLGTGKTALTKAIAEGLGITEVITSPTFNIVKEYRSGRIPLFHFDVYRIGDPEEMFLIGYEEYFYGKGLCVVEWADLIEELIPPEATVINIEYGSETGERIYSIKKGR